MGLMCQNKPHVKSGLAADLHVQINGKLIKTNKVKNLDTILISDKKRNDSKKPKLINCKNVF